MTNLFFPNEDYSILKIYSENSEQINNLQINKINRVWN
ncbi:MAG: hypothetical protein IPH62_05145 [Ignavibacteriae bacterium]|nr:hypothetical protein [Ignavibacteriota bacterium]